MMVWQQFSGRSNHNWTRILDPRLRFFEFLREHDRSLFRIISETSNPTWSKFADVSIEHRDLTSAEEILRMLRSLDLRPLSPLSSNEVEETLDEIDRAIASAKAVNLLTTVPEYDPEQFFSADSKSLIAVLEREYLTKRK